MRGTALRKISKTAYKTGISRILDRLDSETWHGKVQNWLHYMEGSPERLEFLEFLFLGRKYYNPRLNMFLGGKYFESCVLLGAGWDKRGIAVRAMHRLGFAGIEVGSVPEFPQDGNPKPRQFVIAPGVIINRLGFNSPGMEEVARNLGRYGKGIPIGISLGKNKDIPNQNAPQAHARVAECLLPFASWLVLNVSSPNTEGLRELQEKELLRENIIAVQGVIRKHGIPMPLFVKLAPDLTFQVVDEAVDVLLEEGVTGVIACNTTNSPAIKSKYGRRWASQPGGLSGNDADYRAMTTGIIRHIRRQTRKLVIIGVGGVKDGLTALDKICAGASMVQVVSGVRGEGLAVADEINRQVIRYMNKMNVSHISELVGISTDKFAPAAGLVKA